jgi:hypothetical protein
VEKSGVRTSEAGDGRKVGLAPTTRTQRAQRFRIGLAAGTAGAEGPSLVLVFIIPPLFFLGTSRQSKDQKGNKRAEHSCRSHFRGSQRLPRRIEHVSDSRRIRGLVVRNDRKSRALCWRSRRATEIHYSGKSRIHSIFYLRITGLQVRALPGANQPPEPIGRGI